MLSTGKTPVESLSGQPPMRDYRNDLDESQYRAANHLAGPAQVIAGPGSGKTRTLTYRIATLIENHQVEPGRILPLTFTKKAAGEMKTRLEQLLGEGRAQAVPAGTMHAWCYRTLKIQKGRSSATDIVRAWDGGIITDGMQIRLWRQAHEKAQARLTKAGEVSTEVETLKNLGMTHQALEGRAAEDQDDRDYEIAQVWRAYRKLQQNATRDGKGCIDFEDMLLETKVMLERDAELRAELMGLYDFVLIDEAQDLNPVQWQITEHLAPAPGSNLMVVGDEDQAIYAFRGAVPEDLVAFDQVYTESTRYVLDRNYRSHAHIVAAATSLIQHNKNRYDKRLWTDRTAGAPIHAEIVYSPREEAALAVHAIQETVNCDGRSYQDCAILVRCWWQTRALEDALMRARIPYIVVGGASFYGRREIRDVLAYLRLCCDPDDDDALERIFNVPNRFLGAKARERLHSAAERNDCSLFDALRATSWSKPYMRDAAIELSWTITKLFQLSRTEPPYRVIEAMLNTTKYRAYLNKEPDGEDRNDNVDELLETAGDFTSVADLVFYAQQVEASAKRHEDDVDAVSLMTFHRSKGKEFSTVVMTGCADGILPHARSDDLEEERRIAFVGITRAEDLLLMTASTEYRGRHYPPSPYFIEAGLGDPGDPDPNVLEPVTTRSNQ
ncbi:hypothetical protein LCGC14_1270140 [marine sediment metagenome]|uniref:DNA 3'-5' helicase n=1 Tax=marine sediment metagenome TaxID=412755 RepID=A0A0F9LJA6_9ZZZZ